MNYMKKLFAFLSMLILCIGSTWAESKISKAVAGTYLFDSSNPALTVNKGGTATITSDNGAIIIHHDDLSTVTGSRTYAAVVLKVDMPTTAPSSFSKFIHLKTSSNYSGSIGLGVTTESKLKGTWEGNEWNTGGGVVTASAVTGEHTIVLLCNNDGTTIYVDDANTSANKLGLRCGTKWTDLRIEPDYVSYVKSVYVLSGEQKDNVASFFTELSNVVTVANEETKSVSENSTATRFFVASGGTLTADVDYDADKIEVAGNIEIASTKTLNVNVAGFDLTKITGEGNVTLDADATISGSKSTVATGKLTINEGKTLTLGTGQGQANSIASFTSIDLAGTIKHNNSVATFNSVTVPTGKTGKIFAYDMGGTSDGFKLAGTTTLEGDLVVCSKYNFQMKVDVLAGSGGCLICGTTGDNYDASGTSSNEAATINIASASSYTGNATVNNSKATVNLAGNLVASTWTKTNGTLNYAGNNLNGTTLDGVVLNSTTARITTSNTVNIKNLAGCNLPDPSRNYGYSFIGSGTINFYGTCDLTKKSDGTTDALSSNLGYGSSATIVVKENATLKAGVIFNTRQNTNNASITVENGGTITTIGWTHDDGVLYATNLVNNGTINISTGRKTSGYGISTIHNTLSGSGTLNIAEGANLEVASVPSTITLSGSGNVKLTAFPTSTAPTLSSWTGAVEFPTNSSASNITDIFNAWGNENSTIKLNDISGYFSDTSNPVNPTLNILENKTLTITNGFSDNPPVLSKLTGKGNINLSWTGWRDNFNLTIQKLTGFEGTLTTATAPINVEKLYLSLSAAPNADALLIKTSGSGTVTLNKLYIGLEPTTAYTWETKTVDEVTGIYVATFDQVQLYREMAVATVSPYCNHIGTGVGKYTVTLGSTPYTNVDELKAAIEAWSELSDCSTPTVTINQPTDGFYRFHIGDNYMCSDEDDNHVRTATTTNDDASTIFYLDANNYLIAYSDGYGFNYGYCRATTPGIFNGFDFSESATIGYYNIHSNAGTGDATWSDRNITINTDDNILTEGQGTWTIEPVESLPLTLAANSYTSFSAPVAITIPGNCKAYIAKTKNNNTIKMEEVTGNVPANTGIIIGTEADANPTFTVYNGSDFANCDGNILASNVAASALSRTDNYFFGKQKTTGKYIFTKLSGTGDNYTLYGHKAYLPQANIPDSGSEARIAVIWDDDPTGLNELKDDSMEVKDGKYYQNQKIVVIRNGVKYNVAGQIIK